MMDFDDILPYIGGFGRFQMYVYGLLCLPTFYTAMPGLAKIFLLSVPDHWCQTEGVDAWNLTLEEVKNLTLPLELKYGLMTYSQCRMYDVNFSEVLANGGSPVGDITWPVTPCKHGWVYDKTYYMDTAASEWDLVCDKAVMASTILTVIGAAGIPGLFIFGTIGDKFGRRVSFLLCLIVTFFGAFVALSPDLITFSAISFIASTAIPSGYIGPYLLSVEILAPERRSYMSVLIWVFYAFGYMALAGIASRWNSWRTLVLITTLPAALFFPYYWLLPESPRWLMTSGRLEKGNAMIRTIARVNKREIPHAAIEKLNKDLQSPAVAVEGVAKRVLCMFTRPSLLKTFIIVSYLWTTNAVVYVGLAYLAPAISTNPYIGFLISGAVEVPCYLFIGPIMAMFGRRIPEVVTMLGAGICLLTAIFVNPITMNWLVTLLTMVAKAFMTFSFTVIYVHGAELYPTEVRSTVISCSSMLASVVVLTVPYIIYLNQVYESLPLIIFCVLALSSGIGVLFVPETHNEKLPETIEEAEVFGRNKSMFDFSLKRTPYVRPTTEEEKEGVELNQFS